MFDLLRKWLRRSPSVRGRRAPLALEALEDRCVPAASPLIFAQGKLLLPMDISDAQTLSILGKTSFQVPSNVVSLTTPSGNAVTPPLTGTVAAAPSDLIDLEASVDGGAPVDVPINADGSFSFTPSSSVGNGLHTATFQLLDSGGDVLGSASTGFTLSAVTLPTPTLQLDPASPRGEPEPSFE